MCESSRGSIRAVSEYSMLNTLDGGEMNCTDENSFIHKQLTKRKQKLFRCGYILHHWL